VSITETIHSLLNERILVIDGAMGTQIQDLDIPKEAWIDHKGHEQEGCNELLIDTAPDLIKRIHKRYAMAGADLIKTNTFGTMPWVLDEYQMGERAYELSKKVRSWSKRFARSTAHLMHRALYSALSVQGRSCLHWGISTTMRCMRGTGSLPRG